MIQALTKYFLVLFSLLLFQASGVYARSYPSCTLKSAGHSHCTATRQKPDSQAPHIRQTRSGIKENFKNYFEENEDENSKPVFHKTYIGVSHRFDLAYLQFSRQFFPDILHPFTNYKHWFYTSSCRYIVLRAMQI